MKKILPKILLCLVLILLISSNIFLLSKYREPSIHVQIGLPQFDEESKVSSTIMSPFIEKKEDANTILLAFMLGRPMEEKEFPTDLPHAYLVVHYEGCSYPHRMWLTEDSVIFETSMNDIVSFRQYHNDHNNVVPLLKKMLDSIKNSNFS